MASGSHDQPQPPAAQNRLAQNSASGDSKPTKLPDKSNVEKTTWRSRVRSNDHVSSVTQSSTQDWKSVRGDSNLDVNTSVVHASHNSSPASQRGAGGLLTKDEGQRTKDETKLTKDESQQSASRLASNQTDRQNNTMQWASSTTQHPDANRQNVPQVSPAITAGAQFEQLKQMARPSNSKRFQLDYDIDAVGPEGVRAVELWVTSDAGKNWRRWDTDNDLRSPINVQLDTEGIFGFRILVVSNAGLRTKTPRSGEPADMWVNVDTTQPDAKITGAPYGRGAHAGKLLIHWQASDTNLALRPIKLQFSPRSSGPWTTIKDGLRNQGEYVWKPGMDIPDQIFLRLEARDTAGNVRVHQLASPIDVSGLIPRGHIRGITPIPSPSPENGT